MSQVWQPNVWKQIIIIWGCFKKKEKHTKIQSLTESALPPWHSVINVFFGGGDIFKNKRGGLARANIF